MGGGGRGEGERSGGDESGRRGGKKTCMLVYIVQWLDTPLLTHTHTHTHTHTIVSIASSLTTHQHNTHINSSLHCCTALYCVAMCTALVY